MTAIISQSRDSAMPARGGFASPALTQVVFLALIAAAFGAGLLASGADATSLAVAHDGAAFTRLLRFMAVLKGLIALGATAAVLARLAGAITLPWFAAYAVCGGAMAAGPGLIWGMLHIGVGALLLHGGLFATILLLWRDPAVAERLSALVSARQAERI